MNYEIKPDKTTKNKWYCVLKNPNVGFYDTKVIWGGSPNIVERKITRQLLKWGVESANRKDI